MDRDEPLFLPERMPDRLELWIRAVCGAFCGVFIGFYAVVRLHPAGLLWYVAIFGLAIASCSWGATKYGDSFWTGILPSWRRWW